MSLLSFSPIALAIMFLLPLNGLQPCCQACRSEVMTLKLPVEFFKWDSGKDPQVTALARHEVDKSLVFLQLWRETLRLKQGSPKKPMARLG